MAPGALIALLALAPHVVLAETTFGVLIDGAITHEHVLPPPSLPPPTPASHICPKDEVSPP
jgi:hypothetical protein